MRILFLVAALAQAQNTTAIVGATVIDGLGNAPVQATVLVRGGRIAAVGPRLEAPPGARIVNASGHTLLPGLFDLHTHLHALGPDYGKNLKSYLVQGVTSVADLGAYPEEFEPVRRLLAGGVLAGPRVALAARLSTPGGHGTEAGRSDVFTLEVLTPREGRAAIARLLPYKPDAIKVFTDGWRYGTAADMTSMEQETLAAIVEEAHKAGIKVLTHTVTREHAKIAARAGVDVIAHGIGDAAADEELLAILKARGTIYAPTLAVYEPKGTEAQAARARRWTVLMENTARFRAAGVAFGAGTDSGMPGTPHGAATLRELQLLVRGGLTPLDAITAATGNSARALGVAGERGSITEGKLADLLLVEGAPHLSIADIERVKRVFFGGREVDREALSKAIAGGPFTPLPAVKARAKIDDFEQPRSALDTLWINATDAGHDHTRMTFARTLRAPGNHALSVMARMAEKDKPFARVSVPLSRGGVEPVDASAFRGVRFEVRGDGEYRFLAEIYGQRTKPAESAFTAEAKWKTVRIDFASIGGDAAKLLAFTFEIARPAGQSGWLELDNLRFY